MPVRPLNKRQKAGSLTVTQDRVGAWSATAGGVSELRGGKGLRMMQERWQARRDRKLKGENDNIKASRVSK